jgi:hypothetical protein
MQQGMSLQVNQPKIASGMWLLDSIPDEELKVKLFDVSEQLRSS